MKQRRSPPPEFAARGRLTSTQFLSTCIAAVALSACGTASSDDVERGAGATDGGAQENTGGSPNVNTGGSGNAGTGGDTPGVNCTVHPYKDVDWSTWSQYKASLHTHTTNSDGKQDPATVVDEYHSAEYDILAITDHNHITWPWADFGRDPAALGMLAVRGDEYSSAHHMNAFHEFTKSKATLEEGIPHVHESGGLAHINHPGRYNETVDWYVDWFHNYSSVVGLEVFNQGDRYSTDRELWDDINDRYFAAYGKLVWGYSNDDKHDKGHLYRNFQFMLMPELTEEALRTSQTTGAFYFCYEPGGSGDAKVPRIESLTVDDATKTISISARGANRISWIGPGTTEVAAGTAFDYSGYAKTFVRAILDGNDGDCYTQPFGFEQ